MDLSRWRAETSPIRLASGERRARPTGSDFRADGFISSGNSDLHLAGGHPVFESWLP